MEESKSQTILSDKPINDEMDILPVTTAEKILQENNVEADQDFDPVISKLSQVVLEDEYAGMKVEDDSEYPEVRAAIPATDDPTIPHNTVRAWFIGMVMSTIGAALNMFFSLRSPSITISVFVTTILAWPIGVAWHKFLPNIKFLGIELNPGPFNLKEHTLITIMANVSFGVAYYTDILLALKNFYGKDMGWGFDILSIFATQCLGLSMGGLARKVLVEPPAMIWPSNLITATFLTNIHINDNHPANGWTISRLRFFLYVFAAGFIYYWFPGFIFQALSYFAFVTWIRPQNAVINQLFGASTGLGLIPLTFDWNQIAGYVGSPLIPPASALFTILLSMVTIFWIVVPAVHYSGVWYGPYLPISDSSSYDRFQQIYNVSRIVDKNLTFLPEEYKNYSPIFLSTTFAISYGMSFAAITSVVTHTLCFHAKDIYNQLKNQKKQDVHNRLMKAYKECPFWWYLITFVIFLVFAIVSMRCWNTEMPIYSLFIALLIAYVFLFPVGIIAALTNIQVGLNVLTEFIIGYMVPGKPIAMMFFKTFGYITNSQAVTFASDMKLGQYMKISPRVMFFAQFIATLWGSLVQLCVLRWAEGNIEDICSHHQKNHFTCPGGRVFFNASIIWGVIGPQRQFSHGQMYYGLLFFFLVGAALPIINWLILKKWPNSPVKWLNWPVFFSGTGLIPPATPYNYGSYCFVGLFFNWFVKKRWFHWWSKYNYSLSSGLDIGLAWSSLIVFFTVIYTQATAPVWWGNDVINTTMDMAGTAIQVILPEGEAFGPSTWAS